ncbi:ATP-binding protein [Streptomyces reniochalinae]|uniref:ATP-binding protein n=1 Tax=Streptomyces reniochalinae TaxID=2250578 RepID=A0A367EKT7_9ACTN|nr:ATP-binding protein [Streptomyces reniochalinae]RCG17997.1 ATP-binding protein [Streptomyces reniochalinae]
MNTQTQRIRRAAPPRVGGPGDTAGPAAFAVQLSSTRRGARLARLLATQWMDEHGVPYRSTTSHTAALLVAELATNAVRHCGTIGRDFRLRLTLGASGTARGPVLRIEVTDARADKPLPSGPCRLPDAEEESGRGLVLVDAVAHRWGERVNDLITKTLWAEVDLPE